MTRLFAYIRVSTARQGEHGVSLQEQRAAIERYASKNGLEIVQWFEERETAAKRGRPVFTQMLKLLRKGKADGVVIHKIDRSARNLKDWSDLGELIDQGVEVHFANESVDLHSRGGRLSADIQAVVAADYIRNLREETRKGFYGRLKQGVYPLPAPVGYLDMGGGKPKELDPIKAPLVRRAFELYASGKYNLHTLEREVRRMGLTNREGGAISINGLSVMLNNLFYVGMIRLKSTGEVFTGGHEPLISKALFERVQTILEGKTNTKGVTHAFLFRRLVSCASCGYSLRGELQKGHTYYRCHTRQCPKTCIPEEQIEEAIASLLKKIKLLPEERAYVAERVGVLRTETTRLEAEAEQSMQLRTGQLKDRMNRLTDAYLDGSIDKSAFEERRASLLIDQQDLQKQCSQKVPGGSITDRIGEIVELASAADFLYEMAFPEEKRDLVQILTSNRTVSGKNVAMTLCFPFQAIANRPQNANSSPGPDIGRTWEEIISAMVASIHEAPYGFAESVSRLLSRTRQSPDSSPPGV